MSGELEPLLKHGNGVEGAARGPAVAVKLPGVKDPSKAAGYNPGANRHVGKLDWSKPYPSCLADSTLCFSDVSAMFCGRQCPVSSPCPCCFLFCWFWPELQVSLIIMAGLFD